MGDFAGQYVHPLHFFHLLGINTVAPSAVDVTLDNLDSSDNVLVSRMVRNGERSAATSTRSSPTKLV